MTDFRPHRRRRRTLAVIMQFMVAMSLAASADAQVVLESVTPESGELVLPSAEELERVRIQPALVELVEQLGSDTYETRELALARLLNGDQSKMQIYAALHQLPLSAEQRHRLLEVVRQRLVNLPRGAVGISMQPVPKEGSTELEIRVVELLPGLPAERVLQIGDLITKLDGRPLYTQNDLVNRVQTKMPGDTVSMSVRRAERDEQGQVVLDKDERPVYRVIDVELMLGSADLLANPSGRPMQESPVLRRRRLEADGVAARYAPKPVPIAIRNGGMGSFATGSVRVGSDLVDRHEAIQSLLRQKQVVNSANQAMQIEIRSAWARQLLRLIEQAEDPALSTRRAGVPATGRGALPGAADRRALMGVGRLDHAEAKGSLR